MFKTDSDSEFNAIFNIPQSLFMTVVLSLYQGLNDPKFMAMAFIRAYCAGVMFTALLRLNDAGAFVSRLLRTENSRIGNYLVCAGAIGAIMGVLMNTALTFMATGPVTEFLTSWWHCLGVSIVASTVASCLFSAPAAKIVQRLQRHED